MSSAVKESNSQALVGETGHLTGQASQTAGHTANKLDHPNVFANSWLSHLFDRNGRPHPLTAHLFGLNHSDVNSHPVGSHQRHRLGVTRQIPLINMPWPISSYRIF